MQRRDRHVMRAVGYGLLWPLVVFLGSAAAAMAADAPAPDDAAAAAAPSHAGDLFERDVLTGDWGGERGSLEESGILLGADSIDEVLGTVAGGTGTGAIYEGRLELLATLNLEKLIGWQGATFHANAYQIRGRGLSANELDNNLMTASNIEGARSTRLLDLWIEQVLYEGKLSIRAGQIAADDEFFTSQYAANFINATFGWPASLALDLPSGGAAYPIATPGVRVTVVASDKITVSLAALNGDPAGPGPGDPQRRDGSGTAFRLNDGAFVIGEASYAGDQPSDSAVLPASYKIGAWFHSGRFADQQVDGDGQSLAAPGAGPPATHAHDYGGYAVVDQPVWKDAAGDNRNIGVFLRLAVAPADRDGVSLYADTGMNFKGLFPDRSDDVFGIAIAFAGVSQKARALDADARRFSGLDLPIRDGESAAELTYRCQLAPWWSVQPDLQFIRHPGGGVALPDDPTRRIPNAVVLGMRSALLF